MSLKIFWTNRIYWQKEMFLILAVCFTAIILFLIFNFKENMIEARIIEIAGEVARQHGIDLAEYQTPNLKYDQSNKKWLVFYVRKPPAPPGGHFSVSVDNATGKTEFQLGE